MPPRNDGQIKGKFIAQNGVIDDDDVEYFIKYDVGGSKIDSVQGVVIVAENAKEAIVTLGNELPYFKLLYIRRI